MTVLICPFRQLAPAHSSLALSQVISIPFILLCPVMKIPHLLPNQLIIDNGASDHMANPLAVFSNITAKIHTTVNLPNGGLVPVKHKGTVIIGDSRLVLCVPTFSSNLLSASKLTKDLNCALFSSKIFVISNWKTIGVSEQRNGLYYLLQKPDFTYSPQVSSVSQSLPLDLWHWRLDIFRSPQLLSNYVDDVDITSTFHYKFVLLENSEKYPSTLVNLLLVQFLILFMLIYRYLSLFPLLMDNIFSHNCGWFQ